MLTHPRDSQRQPRSKVPGVWYGDKDDWLWLLFSFVTIKDGAETIEINRGEAIELLDALTDGAWGKMSPEELGIRRGFVSSMKGLRR